MTTKWPVGMRVIKTGIAVALACALSQYILFVDPFFASLGAIAGIGKTRQDSFNNFKYRNMEIIVGAVMGIVMSSLTNSIVILGFSVILSMYLNSFFNKGQSMVSGTIVYLAVVFLNSSNMSALDYALIRVIDTSLGLLIGIVVNLTISGPRDKTEPPSQPTPPPTDEHLRS